MPSTFFESVTQLTHADETEQYLSETYGSATIDGGLGLFRTELVGDAAIQLQTGRAEGSFWASLEIDQYVIATAASTAGWEVGRDTGDMSKEPVLFRPRTPYRTQLGDGVNRAVIFDRTGLQRTARLVYGRDDLDLAFDGARPTDPAAAARWVDVLEIARAHEQAGVLEDDLLRVSLFRLLSVSALASFRLVGDRPALHASAARLLRIHRIAAEFFHDYASLPITIDDAAEAAGATVPELVAAFRAHDVHGSSPAAYLRAVRLTAAHRDLVDGDPTLGDTVAAISRRWGFASPSRFAAHHRGVYGTAPRWVLDR